jgi:hypothetical protein
VDDNDSEFSGGFGGGADQEPLFPTSESERRELQDQLVEALECEAAAELAAKTAATEAKGKVAKCRKRVQGLMTVLRQSKPRK